MLKKLLNNFTSYNNSSSQAEELRQQLQSIFFKLKTYNKSLKEDVKLKFNVVKTGEAEKGSQTSGQITYFLGAYAIRYELDDLQTIQLYRRGKVDNLQFCELLAISFPNQVEYISDPLFVKADIYQLEILINYVVKNKNKRFKLHHIQ